MIRKKKSIEDKLTYGQGHTKRYKDTIYMLFSHFKHHGVTLLACVFCLRVCVFSTNKIDVDF